MKKEYITFCFTQSKQNFYTKVLRKHSLQESYKIAKSNMIKRMISKFGRYNFSDVSFKVNGGEWSKIYWQI